MIQGFCVCWQRKEPGRLELTVLEFLELRDEKTGDLKSEVINFPIVQVLSSVNVHQLLNRGIVGHNTDRCIIHDFMYQRLSRI